MKWHLVYSIDVVKMPDSEYTIIDNTHVVSAWEAEINIQSNVHVYNSPLPSQYMRDLQARKMFLRHRGRQ